MSEKELMPRCPYCGSTMHENLYAYKNGGGWCNFECPNCGAMSPKKENSESCNEAELAAYFVAKKRYKEPNRVLTWEKINGIIAADIEAKKAALMWVEYNKRIGEWGYISKYDEDDALCILCVVGFEDEVLRFASDYGKTWRCWMRNPTAQEMRDTPWEDKDEQ